LGRGEDLVIPAVGPIVVEAPERLAGGIVVSGGAVDQGDQVAARIHRHSGRTVFEAIPRLIRDSERTSQQKGATGDDKGQRFHGEEWRGSRVTGSGERKPAALGADRPRL
jgi:hypothetical protein